MKMRALTFVPLVAFIFVTSLCVAAEQTSAQLISPPKSSDRKTVTQLAYLNSFDEVISRDYAFVVYKEADNKTGKWHLKIKSKETANTSIDPQHPTFRKNLSKAANEGKNYLTTGFNLEPRDGDPRLVENRVYFNQSLEPQYLEIHLITRKSDGSAKDKQVVKVAWPK